MCMFTWIYVYIYIYIYVYTYIHIYKIYICKYIPISIYIRHISIYIRHSRWLPGYVCMYTHIHIYIHMYMHVYVYMYIYIYTYAYVYTHIYIRTCTYICIRHTDMTYLDEMTGLLYWDFIVCCGKYIYSNVYIYLYIPMTHIDVTRDLFVLGLHCRVWEPYIYTYVYTYTYIHDSICIHTYIYRNDSFRWHGRTLVLGLHHMLWNPYVYKYLYIYIYIRHTHMIRLDDMRDFLNWYFIVCCGNHMYTHMYTHTHIYGTLTWLI